MKSTQTIGTENVAVTESPSLSTCSVRIERRGGRGEAGARALERHLQRLSGVHDVDVSFHGLDGRDGWLAGMSLVLIACAFATIPLIPVTGGTALVLYANVLGVSIGLATLGALIETHN